MSKLAKTHPLTGHQEENIIIMQIMLSQVGPTFTEVGLSDCREAGTDQRLEEYDKSENSSFIHNQEYIIEEGEYPTSLWACVTTPYGVHDLCNDIHMLKASVLTVCGHVAKPQVQ